MKARDKDFNNMVDDPYLYCCGSTTLNAVEPDPEDGKIDVPLMPHRSPVMTVFAAIGMIAVGMWVYNKIA
jgi:hypothetical protein